MTKRRLLFVDDERAVLEGLRHRLRPRRREWDMTFVDSGAEALQVLGKEPFDAIVSDMRMPQMDGEALLRRVRQEHPTVARLVLSGHADEAAMLRTLALAHHYLPKPCEPGLLEQAIDRVCGFQALITDEAVKAAVGRTSSLPSRPAVYAQLVASLEHESTTPREVAELLSHDAALCAKLLQLVNSAYFGLVRTVVRVEEAVVFLGLSTVRQLVLAVELFSKAEGCQNETELSLQRLQSHSILTAHLAAELVVEPEAKSLAFAAGLMHDIGKLLLVTALPDRATKLVEELRAQGGAMSAVEARLFGVTHAELGGYLLGMWQLPFAIVEAVANHHAPSRVLTAGRFGVVGAVHVADALACEQLDPVVAGTTGVMAELDLAYLDAVGMTGKLDEWRALAARAAATLGDASP